MNLIFAWLALSSEWIPTCSIYSQLVKVPACGPHFVRSTESLHTLVFIASSPVVQHPHNSRISKQLPSAAKVTSQYNLHRCLFAYAGSIPLSSVPHLRIRRGPSQSTMKCLIPLAVIVSAALAIPTELHEPLCVIGQDKRRVNGQDFDVAATSVIKECTCQTVRIGFWCPLCWSRKSASENRNTH
jgi:hypothetical protein